jgi:hypothetical protein
MNTQYQCNMLPMSIIQPSQPVLVINVQQEDWMDHKSQWDVMWYTLSTTGMLIHHSTCLTHNKDINKHKRLAEWLRKLGVYNGVGVEINLVRLDTPS